MKYQPNLLGNQTSDDSPYVIRATEGSLTNPYLAFDANTTGTWWASAAGSTEGWLSVDFGAGNLKAVAQYVHTLYNEHYHCPDNWTFEASNDNTNWTVLDTRTDQAQFYGTAKSYTFLNSTKYRYYRINVSKVGNPGDTVIGISDLTMHEALYRSQSPFPSFHRG